MDEFGGTVHEHGRNLADYTQNVSIVVIWFAEWVQRNRYKTQGNEIYL